MVMLPSPEPGRHCQVARVPPRDCGLLGRMWTTRRDQWTSGLPKCSSIAVVSGMRTAGPAWHPTALHRTAPHGAAPHGPRSPIHPERRTSDTLTRQPVMHGLTSHALLPQWPRRRSDPTRPVERRVAHGPGRTEVFQRTDHRAGERRGGAHRGRQGRRSPDRRRQTETAPARPQAVGGARTEEGRALTWLSSPCVRCWTQVSISDTKPGAGIRR